MQPDAMAAAPDALAEALDLPALEDAARDSALMPQVSALAPGELDEGLGSIFRESLTYAGGYWTGAARTAGLVISITLLCMLVRLLAPGGPQTAVQVAGALAITAACAGSLKQLVGLGAETIQELQMFSNALLPTLAAAVVAAGAPSTSSAIYVSTVFFGNLLTLVFTDVFVPLIYAYVVAGAADAALGGDLLHRIGGLCKWVVTSGLKLLLTVYLGWLTVTGVISGSADAATIKAAKLALSTAVPVVGSIISDASETVLVSASLLKNAIGVFGMLAVFSIAVLPFLRIGIHYLAFKLTAAIAGSLDGGGLGKLIDVLTGAMGMLLAMTGIGALLLVISIVCSMKAVTG